MHWSGVWRPQNVVARVTMVEYICYIFEILNGLLPVDQVKHVLELNSGTVRQLNIPMYYIHNIYCAWFEVTSGLLAQYCHSSSMTWGVYLFLKFPRITLSIYPQVAGNICNCMINMYRHHKFIWSNVHIPCVIKLLNNCIHLESTVYRILMTGMSNSSTCNWVYRVHTFFQQDLYMYVSTWKCSIVLYILYIIHFILARN